MAFDLPPETIGYPAGADLAERRRGIDAGLAAGTWTVAPAPAEMTLGMQRCLRFTPDAAPNGQVIHYHGGAFRSGCPEIEGPFARALADRCQVEVIVPQYRLAPEHPFPAGLNDAAAALKAVVAQRSGLPLIVSGDSAGGGLAASVALLALQEAIALAGVIMLSPWLDLTVNAASYTANAASDPIFSRESAADGAELYLQGLDPKHPLASPFFALLADFPPSLISVGTGEVLADDSLRMHQLLRDAGRPCELCAIDGMEHVAVVRSLAMPGAAQTFDQIAAFIDAITSSHLSR